MHSPFVMVRCTKHGENVEHKWLQLIRYQVSLQTDFTQNTSSCLKIQYKEDVKSKNKCIKSKNYIPKYQYFLCIHPLEIFPERCKLVCPIPP